MCDFILFLRNKKLAIFELECMCSVFTFVQYKYSGRDAFEKLKEISFVNALVLSVALSMKS